MSRPAGKPARAVTPGSQCWVRSRAGVAPYELVRVSEVSADATALVVADAAGEAGEAARWRVRCAELHPANVETQADNVALFEFSEAALLDNILRRYADATPYTYTGAILTSVNPCTPLRHLYTGEVMASYVGQRLGGGPPHLFAVAEETYRQLMRPVPADTVPQQQGLVVSGVSGAGKTEANKIIVRYLCWRAAHVRGHQRRDAVVPPEAIAAANQLGSGNASEMADLSRRVIVSQALLESFGNTGASACAGWRSSCSPRRGCSARVTSSSSSRTKARRTTDGSGARTT